ncbi:hypothetical protein E2C01_040666 [Portunus trituberculatus]|uniref:Uncharacterized protein n=1 Tax=Portunus trituberculatus TaxID=210409 RepID=A0A5B7FN88_PORTR|nr:hypothetical protein [Portunus trituberculatus]
MPPAGSVVKKITTIDVASPQSKSSSQRENNLRSVVEALSIREGPLQRPDSRAVPSHLQHQDQDHIKRVSSASCTKTESPQQIRVTIMHGNVSSTLSMIADITLIGLNSLHHLGLSKQVLQSPPQAKYFTAEGSEMAPPLDALSHYPVNHPNPKDKMLGHRQSSHLQILLTQQLTKL